MELPRNRWHWILIGVVAGVVGIGLWWSTRPTPIAKRPSTLRHRGTHQDDTSTSFWQLPDPKSSKYLNTIASVAYVGHDACTECHADAHASYLLTPHSQALADINVDEEPPDAQFDHHLSRHRYKVVREDSKLVHRDAYVAKGGEEIPLSSYPLRYRIGSGHHSRSYLAEVDGFLFESPVTWYTSRQEWRMSPGYDAPVHGSFERLADVGCLQCHAGQVESLESRFRIRIHQDAISCENCHGPGALHVQQHRDQADVATTSNTKTPQPHDLSIVNPKHLTRAERQAICAQCHLRSAATVAVRGRSFTDFRPGLRLEDFRVDYRLENKGTSMTVVGHIEQLEQSKCYQASPLMSCTTCHDPHASAPTTDTNYFRDQCLQCHEDCDLSAEARSQQGDSDNCIGCHMPKSATDIPHFAFTHHRIGLHEKNDVATADSKSIGGNLVPTSNISHLPQWERDRCLAFAHLEFSQGKRPVVAAFHRKQAFRLLSTLQRDGLQDTDVTAALARLHWERGTLSTAISLAEDAIEGSSNEGSVANALLVLGDSYLQQHRPDLAREPLTRLTKMRRQSADSLLLATCLQELDDIPAAISACRKAIEIRPDRAEAHRLLADLLELNGDTNAAAQEHELAKQLDQNAPRSAEK